MNIENIIDMLEQQEHGNTLGPFDVAIDCLSQDPTFQVRHSLNPGNIERLKSAYKAGKTVAPITVALTPENDGRLLVVDGHHRMTALEIIAAEHGRAGSSKPVMVNALFVRLTTAEARWQAAQANMGHGQPLTNREIRKAFQRFVKAGHHRNVDGSCKSYRQIGKEFGKTHPTMRTWMLKDFPNEAREMKDDSISTNAGGTGIPAPSIIAKHKAFEGMRTIAASFDVAFSYERAEVIDALRSLLADLEETHGETDAFTHDEAMRDRSKPEVTVDDGF
jgi:hypothetical protein